MFGVALSIRVGDFKSIVRFPKSAIIGLISQFVLLPLVTTLLALVLRKFISPTIAFGMILVACCPGGNISNFMTAHAKGNTALSITLTAFSTISAIVITPLNFSIWGKVFTLVYNANELLRPLEINSIEMFRTVLLLLGLPVILGMGFAYKFPSLTKKTIKPCKNLSIVAFLAMVIFAFANNYTYFIQYIGQIFFIVLVHNAVAFMTGYSFASAAHLNHKDIKTVTIETGIQNSGLALVLLFNPQIFPPELAIGGMAFITAWWGVWHIISGLAVSTLWSLPECHRHHHSHAHLIHWFGLHIGR